MGEAMRVIEGDAAASADERGSELVLRCVERLALRLAEHRHRWSEEDRRLYERAVARLGGRV